MGEESKLLHDRDETSTSQPPLSELLDDENSSSQPLPFAPNTLLGWDLSQACFSHTQSDPLPIQADSSLYHSNPFLNQPGYSHTQAGYPNTQDILELPCDDGFCSTELDSEMDLTYPCLDHTFSFGNDLFPELDSYIDLNTPLSETDPSNIQEDHSSFWTFPIQIGPSQTQAGPYQAQAGPSNTRTVSELESKTVKCIHCEKFFASNDNLGRHVRIKHEETPIIECYNCGRHFSKKNYLQQHIRNKHSDNKDDCERYTCPKCGRTYTLKCNLTRHLRLECGIPPQFSCSQCSFKTRRQSNLKLHMDRIHRSESCERYTCPKCGRTYTSKCSLSRHLRLECGIPPQFGCSQCSFKTHHKNSLKRHMLNKHESNFLH